MWKRAAPCWDRDVLEAMKGVDDFSVSTSPTVIAACLWDCGEDALAERALAMTADVHAAIQRIQAVYEDSNYPLPVQGQRITHRHVSALAAIAYFEGRLRPLAQTRRRPEKLRPARFNPYSGGAR
jgi:hypothetical protein